MSQSHISFFNFFHKFAKNLPTKYSLLPAGQDLPQAALPVLFLLTGRFLEIFAPEGRHVEPIKVKFGREERTNLPNLTLIGSGVGVYGPKTEKNRILPI